MNNDILVKTFKAEGDIPGNRIIKLGTGDNTVAAASAVGDRLIGISHATDAKAGYAADVTLQGIATVKAGGAINKGEQVTTDASGQAVSKSAATNSRVGVVLTGASAGDLVPVLLSID